ncbi:MFS transporter [Thalassotalea sp. HSM 43]|uniref:MFS transporter n=1 Tax=Thalassotalea sp. HSM 43 TaxID=2552945 RepID=UPI001081C45A|nr:MFS transporter [Thalassotalea sp. HSM 43]QBY04513.1 MFS transporter [Thalassotalea sp. HSM 43]
MTTKAKKYLGITTHEGVSGWNMTTFYVTCVATILLGTFINAFQPYLYTEIMNIDRSEHGAVTGTLNFWGEIAIIATVGLWGALSDKIGRKLIMSIGFTLIAIALYLYPHADSVGQLVLYRCIYGVGIAGATCMIVTLVADYAKDESRGKAAGLQGMCNGLGAVTALFVILRLPDMFQADGMSPVDAGITTYNITAALSFIIAIVSWIGLKSHVKNEMAHTDSTFAKAMQGIRAAKNQGIALAYAASFVSRANLTIVGAFMTLWLSNYGTAEAGMNASEALKKAGMIVALAQGCALLGAPFFGILTDKINRVTALLIALFISFVGYTSTYFITDPFGGAMIVVVVIIGLSEIGGIITSGVLIAQQTTEKNRGAVIGIFNLSGAIGILVSSVIGGYLFDHWDQSGPFVFIGLCALAVFIWGLMVRGKVSKQLNDHKEALTTPADAGA